MPNNGTVTESSFRIGLARAFYAKRQSDGKYSAPVEFEFPEECDIKINGGDAQSIYAGDQSRWRKAGATSKELSVQMTHFKRSFLQDCLGFVAESTTGGITDTVRVVDTNPVQGTLGLEAQNGAFTFGLNYRLTAGGDDRMNNSFNANVRYAF